MKHFFGGMFENILYVKVKSSKLNNYLIETRQTLYAIQLWYYALVHYFINKVWQGHIIFFKLMRIILWGMML
jgi:hypothetical protein